MSPADALILENYVLIGNALRVYAKHLDGSAVDARTLGGGVSNLFAEEAADARDVADRIIGIADDIADR